MAFNIISALTALVAKPSAFLAAGFFDYIGRWVMSIWSSLIEIFYFAIKWMMYFTDLIFIYVQQLAGLNSDMSSMGSMFSQDADMVFNMLISNSELVTMIIRNMIGLALIILIIFSIIAIIKSQFASLNSDEPAKVGTIMKGMLKSILLMFLTPIIGIVGIGATNVLLKSLYAATNPSNSTGISNRIFATSAAQANIYRVYASEGNRIPITYDFTTDEEIIDIYLSGEKELDANYDKYVESSVIYNEYVDVQDGDYDSFYDLRVENQTELETYHSVCDRKIGVTAADPLAKYKRIRTYVEEYFVMADVIQYAIETSNALYMKTIEQVLESYVELPDGYGESLFNDLVGLYGIEFYRSNNLTSALIPDPDETMFDLFKSKNYQVVRFTSRYNKVLQDGSFAGEQQIQYNHLKNTYDEIDGAVFLMSGERTIEVDGVNYTYLVPLSIGYDANHSGSFKSDYIRRNQMVVAKGIFDLSMAQPYPTAIRLSADRTELQFYRDTIEIGYIGEEGNLLKFDMAEEKQESGFVKFIKALFNPLSLLPRLLVNNDSIDAYYLKVTKQVNRLNNAKLHIGYLYTDGITSALSGNLYGLNLSNLFIPSKINIFILLFAAATLLKCCFVSVFALIRRSYELFLLMLTFPIGCATMPLDDGQRYSKWMEKYMDKVFLTYGLILGINFVILLFPVIETIQFISPENIVQNVAASRVAMIVGGNLISVDTKARLFNTLLALVAEIILFSLLVGPDSSKDKSKDEKGFITMIQKIANPKGTSTIYDENAGAEMIKVTKQMALLSGKAIVTAVTKVPNEVINFVAPSKDEVTAPGDGLKVRARQKAQMKDAKGKQNAALGNLKDLLSKGADAAQIAQAMGGVNKAQDGVAAAAGYGTKEFLKEKAEEKEAKKAEKKAAKAEKKSGGKED